MNWLKAENKVVLLAITEIQENRQSFLSAAIALFDSLYSRIPDEPIIVGNDSQQFRVQLPQNAIGLRGRCKIYHAKFKILERL